MKKIIGSKKNRSGFVLSLENYGSDILSKFKERG
jgi:hypothetical protein